MKSTSHFCPHCGKRFRVKKRKTGARLRCPSCAGVFTLNAESPEEPEGRRKTASGLTLERNSEAARLSYEALRQAGDGIQGSEPELAESSGYLPAGQDPTRFGADDSDSRIEEVSSESYDLIADEREPRARRRPPARRPRASERPLPVFQQEPGDGLAWGLTLALVIAPLAIIALCLTSTVRDRGFAAKGAIGAHLEALGRGVQRGVRAIDKAGPGFGSPGRERSK